MALVLNNGNYKRIGNELVLKLIPLLLVIRVVLANYNLTYNYSHSLCNDDAALIIVLKISIDLLIYFVQKKETLDDYFIVCHRRRWINNSLLIEKHYPQHRCIDTDVKHRSLPMNCI